MRVLRARTRRLLGWWLVAGGGIGGTTAALEPLRRPALDLAAAFIDAATQTVHHLGAHP